jgi:hypothetical protein
VANKVSVLIDIVTDGAQDSVKKLTKSMREADTLSGKFKVGWEGALGAVKKNAAEFAVVAGAALVAFGVKAVNAFTETALAAGKFSDATGIAVDDASRWMEVGGDVGIGADAIQGAIQKMNKALADGKPAFADYGVEVVRTSDGMVDANATFRNALTTIGAIPDPTKRAQAAQQVFGKSYGEVARLMEMSADDLKAALDGVGDAQVIDESELKKAREFEAAMDDLKDSAEGVALLVGELLTPALTEAAETIADVRDIASDAADSGLGKLIDKGVEIPKFIFGLKPLRWTIGEVRDAFGEADEQAEELATSAADVGDAADTAARGVRTFSDSADLAALNMRMAKEAADGLKEVLGELDDEAAALDLEQQFVDLRTAAEEAFVAAVNGSEDSAQKQRDYQNALIETKRMVAEYGAEVLGLPPEQTTRIVVNLDGANLDAVESRLRFLARNRDMFINGRFVGTPDQAARRLEGYGATGGIVNRPTVALIGEAGPEAVIPLNRTPGNSPLPGGMGGNTTVNIYTNADPNSTKAALRRFDRRNGPGI